jgi:hypothetical protein
VIRRALVRRPRPAYHEGESPEVPMRPPLLPSSIRRAIPALLAVWGAALLGVAVLDWAGYGTYLHLAVLAR